MAKSTMSPIDDLTFDVITVLRNKAHALGTYDKYIGDAQAEDDVELEELFVEMRKHDEENVVALKEVLARRLDEDLGYDEEDDEDSESEDYEANDESLESPDDVTAAPKTTSPPPRRGESTERQR